MALRNVIQEPSDRLRKICRPVAEITPRILELLDDMAETMRDADGVGLAAPQVGVLRRVVVIDVGSGLVEMVNPIITHREGEKRGEEACLSCGDRRGVVVRPEKVTVEYLDRNGEKHVDKAEGLYAVAICHETDHLDGGLFIDIMEREIFGEDEEESAGNE